MLRTSFPSPLSIFQWDTRLTWTCVHLSIHAPFCPKINQQRSNINVYLCYFSNHSLRVLFTPLVFFLLCTISKKKKGRKGGIKKKTAHAWDSSRPVVCANVERRIFFPSLSATQIFTHTTQPPFFLYQCFLEWTLSVNYSPRRSLPSLSSYSQFRLATGVAHRTAAGDAIWKWCAPLCSNKQKSQDKKKRREK